MRFVNWPIFIIYLLFNIYQRQGVSTSIILKPDIIKYISVVQNGYLFRRHMRNMRLKSFHYFSPTLYIYCMYVNFEKLHLGNHRRLLKHDLCRFRCIISSLTRLSRICNDLLTTDSVESYENQVDCQIKAQNVDLRLNIGLLTRYGYALLTQD